VEQDPLAIWESVQEAIRLTLERAAAAHGEVVVRAVGITNQRE
jgi:glycerol kinase